MNISGCQKSRTVFERCSAWVPWSPPAKLQPAGEQLLKGGHQIFLQRADIWDVWGGHQIFYQGAVSNGAWFSGSNPNSSSSVLPKEADEDPKVGGWYPDNHLGNKPGAVKPVRGISEPSERELSPRRCCCLCWLDTQVITFYSDNCTYSQFFETKNTGFISTPNLYIALHSMFSFYFGVPMSTFTFYLRFCFFLC